jgi:probable F420-dependent oxidoreductase
MVNPRVGVSLPSFGPHAGPEAIAAVATAAERLGFHSVSVTERLLLPAHEGWVNEAGLPDWPVYDPIEVLTWVAARTRRVRLLSAVVNSLFQPPIVLARRLATLDHLSGGRLDVGIGQGWLPEEFAASGVPMGRRGVGFEEHLAAMRACWAPDPVCHDGLRYRIPKSRVGPKPVHGRIPVLIGALARPAVERAARLGDGFVTALRDWDASRTEIGWYRAAGGTGPVVLAMMPEWAGTGDLAAIGPAASDDLARAAAAGVEELHWGLSLSGADVKRQVAALEAVAAAVL